MANMETVFRKVKELHLKLGGGNPVITMKRMERALLLTPEEMKRHIMALRGKELLQFANTGGSQIALTPLGHKTRL